MECSFILNKLDIAVLEHLRFFFAGIKPFQCDRCGKKFTRAYSLKMHRLKHEGKRCFRCQICSATFTSFGEYKHHMRVSRHIIRKPRIYECKTCGAMFTNSGNLIVHLRSLNHEASELASYFQSRWGLLVKYLLFFFLKSHILWLEFVIPRVTCNWWNG